MKTRIDPTHRLELVTNRISFLGAEKERIDTEIESLNAEHGILLSLKSLYAKQKDDPIDAERAAFYSEIENRNPIELRSSVSKRVLSVLSDGKEYDTAGIAKASGLTVDQVRDAIVRARAKGDIENTAWGVYRKVSK
jgi:hypothetical protein